MLTIDSNVSTCHPVFANMSLKFSGDNVTQHIMSPKLLTMKTLRFSNVMSFSLLFSSLLFLPFFDSLGFLLSSQPEKACDDARPRVGAVLVSGR